MTKRLFASEYYYFTLAAFLLAGLLVVSLNRRSCIPPRGCAAIC